MRCNRCHRLMEGTTAYDGACECGGLIEADELEPEHPNPARAALSRAVNRARHEGAPEYVNIPPNE